MGRAFWRRRAARRHAAWYDDATDPRAQRAGDPSLSDPVVQRMELRESFPGSAAQTFWGRDRTPTLRGVLVSSALLIACIAAASALIIVFGEHTHHQALNDALKIVQMCLVALAGLTVVVAVSIAVVRGLRTERDTDRQIRQRQEAQGRSRASRRGTRHTVEPSDPA